jgi:hypothetical protein
MARIVAGNTRQLLVLTADQILHRIPLPAPEAAPPAATAAK